MGQTYGSVFLYNLIFIFLAIIFSFLMGTLIYHRAFITNTRIINALEKYEGYNKYSINEIELQLESAGYPRDVFATCPSTYKGLPLSTPVSTKYSYCVYLLSSDGLSTSGSYYSYGVITFIKFDIPIISSLVKIPIYSESNRIYNFG